MKTISIQDLKRDLSALVAEAAAGATIVITKHRRPIAVLGAAVSQHLHTGAQFGKRGIKRLLRNATGGRYLETLTEDREADR